MHRVFLENLYAFHSNQICCRALLLMLRLNYFQLKQWKNQFHVNVWVIDVDKTAYFQSSILHPDWLLEDLKCLSHGQNSSHFIQSPF